MTERTRSDERDSSVLAFVVARSMAHHEMKRPRCYGRSSDALTLYALGVGPRPVTPGWSETGSSWRGEECGTEYPLDEGDLAACELTFEMAPAEIRDRMAPVLDEFRTWVREKRNRHGAAFPYAKPVAAGATERTTNEQAI